MNRSVSLLAVSLLSLFFILAPVPGMATAASEQGDGSPPSETSSIHDDGTVEKNGDQPQVSLTEKQKKRLAKIHQRLYEDHVKLIKLYAEYGLISEEKKEKKLKWLDEHHKRIQQNGYLPCTGKKPREEKFHRHVEP